MKTCIYSGLLVGIFALIGAGTANAGHIPAHDPNDFNVQVGESPRLLEAQLLNSRSTDLLSDAALAEITTEETCVNPVARYQNRNRFSILVENTSTTNSLTSFSLNLEAMGFEFGNGDFAGDGFGGMLAIDMGRSDAGVGFSASYGADRSELVMNFTGMTPGRAVIFRVDLDPSAANTTGLRFPDYREAVLGANGNDLALVGVGFSAGNQFTNLPFMAGTFAGPINTSVLEPYHAQTLAGRSGNGDSSFPFSLNGSSTVIPEPGSAALLLVGLMGLGSRRMRRLSPRSR